MKTKLNNSTANSQPIFNILENKVTTGLSVWDITISNDQSDFLKFCINSSRVFWYLDLVKRLGGCSDHEIEEYHLNNKFAIDGSNLNPFEIAEQKRILICKIFTIGYLLHKRESGEKPLLPLLLDSALLTGYLPGPSGKSLFLNYLSVFTNSYKLYGREFNSTELDKESANHDLVIIDDMSLDTISKITNIVDTCSNTHVAMTTNEFSEKYSAISDQLLLVEFSNYYSLRKPADDFGKNLIHDITQEERNADIDFINQCLNFYLDYKKQYGIESIPSFFKRA